MMINVLGIQFQMKAEASGTETLYPVLLLQYIKCTLEVKFLIMILYMIFLLILNTVLRKNGLVLGRKFPVTVHHTTKFINYLFDYLFSILLNISVCIKIQMYKIL